MRYKQYLPMATPLLG